MIVDMQAIDKARKEVALALFRPAQILLESAGVKFDIHVSIIVNPAELITKLSQEYRCNLIVMGARTGTIKNLLLESYRTKSFISPKRTATHKIIASALPILSQEQSEW